MGLAQFPKLTTYNSKLYAVWVEGTQVKVAVYNSNDDSPHWSFVNGNTNLGLNFASSNPAVIPEFGILNSKLYITWAEGSPFRTLRVAVYNGNDSSPHWSFVDGGNASGLNLNLTRTISISKLTTLDLFRDYSFHS